MVNHTCIQCCAIFLSDFPCTPVMNKKPVFEIPTIREYFVDLEYVLGVISGGPAKSFAFRRLKYLSSKFTMYSLLHEFQELADIKVRLVLF
jgi:AMP deaminase